MSSRTVSFMEEKIANPFPAHNCTVYSITKAILRKPRPKP